MLAHSAHIIDTAETDLSVDLSNIDQVFSALPLESYAELLLDVPERWPRLRSLLPSMPSDEVQVNWTGNHGPALLAQSVSFLRIALSYVPAWQARHLGLRALDFGCGWGRLLRLMGKYYPPMQLEGVDPWHASIQLCRECGIRNPLSVSDYLPDSLPTHNTHFDLIYAFSVFTHLSPYATKKCLHTLRRYLTPTGVLLITVRPVEYWDAAGNSEKAQEHRSNGQAYVPHNFHVLSPEGEPVYGDASLDPEILSSYGFKVVGIEHSTADPLQMIVAIRPTESRL